MDFLERITIDLAIRFGKPCVRGEAELLANFPQLCYEDVLACLAIGNDSKAITAD